MINKKEIHMPSEAESIGSREPKLEAPRDVQSLGSSPVRRFATLTSVERPKFDPEEDENKRLYGKYGAFPALEVASD